ncbi:MAG: hypothetical protein EZS28_046747, partial [Streblomastix strix]
NCITTKGTNCGDIPCGGNKGTIPETCLIKDSTEDSSELADPDKVDDDSFPIGAIIGIILGVLGVTAVVIIIIIVVAIFVSKKRKRSKLQGVYDKDMKAREMELMTQTNTESGDDKRSVARSVSSESADATAITVARFSQFDDLNVVLVHLFNSLKLFQQLSNALQSLSNETTGR